MGKAGGGGRGLGRAVRKEGGARAAMGRLGAKELRTTARNSLAKELRERPKAPKNERTNRETAKQPTNERNERPTTQATNQPK